MKIGSYEYVAQSEFWDFFLAQEDAPYLLKSNVDAELRRSLFKKYVAVVNIETASYCNRKCAYCPVTSLKNKTKEYIDDALFFKIVSELEGIEFSGIVTLNLFNEPLSDFENYLERLAFLRTRLPSVYIRSNSNGDYLNQKKLQRLIDAGLNELLVTYHLKKGDAYSDDEQLGRINKHIDKLNLNGTVKQVGFDRGRNITFEGQIDNFRILLVSNNWSQYGVDRAGTVPALSVPGRSSPCLVPFREITIDYEGRMLWCWNIFRESDHSFSDLAETSILATYFGERAVKLRRHLFDYSEKMDVCNACTVSSFSDRKDESSRERILNK